MTPWQWCYNQYKAIVTYDEIGDPVERIKAEMHAKNLFWTFQFMFVRGLNPLLTNPTLSTSDRVIFTIWCLVSVFCTILARLRVTKWLGPFYGVCSTLLVYAFARLNPLNSMTIAIFGLIWPNFFIFLSHTNSVTIPGVLCGLFLNISQASAVRTIFEENGANANLLFLLDKFKSALYGYALSNFVFTSLANRKFDKIQSCWTQHHQETEKVKAETRILQEKNLFFSCFSHELRNPLNCILGSIEYALKYTTDDVICDILSSGKLCGDLLINLINNILDLGKLDSKNLSLNESARDSRTFIRNIWKVTQELLKKKKIQGELFVSRNFPPTICIDESRLTQVLVNLISNAAKFTETNGSVRIIFTAESGSQVDDLRYTTNLNHIARVQSSSERAETKMNISPPISPRNFNSVLTPTQRHNTPGFLQNTPRATGYKSMKFVNETADDLKHVLLYSSYRSDDQIADWVSKGHVSSPTRLNMLKIEVIDSGCGMTEDERHKLFQPFVQANNTISSKYGGTGLGLYISKSIIDLMKGRISVISHKEVGSCFMAVFPIETFNSNCSMDTETMKRNGLGSAFKIVIDNHDEDLMASILGKFEKRDGFVVKFLHENQKLEEIKLFATYSLVFHIKEVSIQQMNILSPSNISTGKIVDIFYTRDRPNHAWDPIKMKDQLVFTKLEDINNFIETRAIEVTQNIKSCSGILIVDDDEFNRKVLSVFLKKEGYKIFFAENGQLGFEEFYRNQDKIDLVIVDYEMPVLDGPGCAKKILTFLKENDKETVPVYTLTGNISQETKQIALQSGVSKVFTKPAKMELIVGMIFEEIRMRKNKQG